MSLTFVGWEVVTDYSLGLSVYIGKFRGRRVAIAEFRGHLGPSRCSNKPRRPSVDEDPLIVDIKELKLLSDFNHPNVVRFVRRSDYMSIATLTLRRSWVSASRRTLARRQS